jgi:hypothetical protein
MDNRARAILLSIVFFIMLSLSFLVLANPRGRADISSKIPLGVDATQKDNLVLDFTHVYDGLTEQVFDVEIRQDEAMNKIRNADINFFIDALSYSTDKAENSLLVYEWQLTSHAEPIYDLAEKCLEDLNGTKTCWAEQIENGSRIIQNYDWVQINKQSSEKDAGKYKEEFGRINIPIYDLGKSQDETAKKYRVIIHTPMEKREDGTYGSSGILKAEIDGNIFYDTVHSSDWNSSYSYARMINYTNTGIVTAINGTAGLLGETMWTIPTESNENLYYNTLNNSVILDGDNETQRGHEYENDTTSARQFGAQAMYQSKYIPAIWHLSNYNNSAQTIHNFSKSGTPVFVAGRFGKGLNFTGESEAYINHTDFEATEKTIIWLMTYGTADSGTQHIISKNIGGSGGVSGSMYGCEMNNYKIQCFYRPAAGGGAEGLVLSATALVVGTPYCIAVTINDTGKNVTVFINGTAEKSALGSSARGTGTGNFYFSGSALYSGYNLTAMVDELQFYNTTLSNAQINQTCEVLMGLNRAGVGAVQTGSNYATESQGDSAIQQGIANSIINSSSTNYTSQQIYIRNVTGQQQLGRFDVVASSGNQRWAFNYVTSGDSTSSFTYMVNITPALYVWEAGNKTAAQITSEVQAFIDATKQ